MHKSYKILAPVDLALNAGASVEYATGVANAMEAELMLLYVIKPGERKQASRAAWPPSPVDGSRKYFDIDRIVLPGDPVRTIVRYADFVDADLILMPSDRFRENLCFWQRSVTARVMELTGRPLWVTNRKGSIHDDFRYERILCALHLDGTDEPVLNHASNLARRYGAELIVWATVPEISEGMLHDVHPMLNMPLSRMDATERMERLVKNLLVPYQTCVMTGSSYSAIRSAVRENAADLVVAARAFPSHTRPYHLDMRSLQRLLPCPLLTVTAGAASMRRDDETVEAVAVGTSYA